MTTENDPYPPDTIWGLAPEKYLSIYGEDLRAVAEEGLAVLKFGREQLPKHFHSIHLSEDEYELAELQFREMGNLSEQSANGSLPQAYKFHQALFGVLASTESIFGLSHLIRLTQYVLISLMIKLEGVESVLVDGADGIPGHDLARTYLNSAVHFVRRAKSLTDDSAEEIWREIEDLWDDAEVGAEELISNFQERLRLLKNGKTGEVGGRIRELRHVIKLLGMLNEPNLEPVKTVQKAIRTRRKTVDIDFEAERLQRAEEYHQFIRRKRVRDSRGKYTLATLPVFNQSKRQIELMDERSGNSIHALPVEMMREVVAHLRPHLTDEKIEKSISAAVIILSSITGRRFHDLLAALTPGDIRSGGSNELRFSVDDNGNMVLNFLPQSLDDRWDREEEAPGKRLAIEGGWSLQIPTYVTVPIRRWQTHLIDRDDEAVEEICKTACTYQWYYWDYIRNHHKSPLRMYTETSLRTGFFQILLQQTDDVALCQLIIGDKLGLGLSSLNYVVWPRSLIESSMAAVAAEVSGQDAQPERSDANPDFVGTAKAKEMLERYEGFGTKLREHLPAIVGKKGENSRHISEYNRLLYLVGAAFIVATGHRNNINLRDLTSGAVSPTFGLAVLGEKPSDLNHYRRIVAFPQTVSVLLGKLAGKLDNMRRNKRLWKRLSPEAKAAFDAFFSGTGSLFFELFEDGDQVLSKPWDSAGFWRLALGSDCPTNGHRHNLSTWLRMNTNISPSLIECQMGHATAPDFFGDLGCGAPTEFAEQMSEALEEFLISLGFEEVRPQPSRPLKWIFDYQPLTLSDDFQKKHQKELKRDKDLFAKQSGDAARKRVSDELLYVSAIERLFKELDLPEEVNDVFVSQVIIRETIGGIKSESGGNFTQVERILKRIRRFLWTQRDEKDWEIEWPHHSEWHVGRPLDITPACTVSAEYMSILRREIIRSNSRPDNDRLAQFVLNLAVFGDVRNVDQMGEIITGLGKLKWAKGLSYGAVPIPIYDDCPDIPLEESGGEAPSRRKTHVADQAFCLTGRPLAAAVGYVSSGAESLPSSEELNTRVHALLPVKFRPKHKRQTLRRLLQLSRLERHVSLPPVFRAVADRSIVTRQLPPDRLINLNLNETADYCDMSDQRKKKARRHANYSSSQNFKSDRDHMQDTISEIMSILKTIAPGNRAEIQQRLTDLRTRSAITAIEKRVVEYFIQLCGPKSNRERGSPRPYRRRSLTTYLSKLEEGLVLLADMGLEAYDPDAFSERFREIVTGDVSTKRQKAGTTLRFFRAMGGRLGVRVPSLQDLAADGLTEAEIDAECFSAAEVDLIEHAVRYRQQYDSTAALHGSELNLSLQRLSFQVRSGTRSGECDYMRLADIREFEGKEFAWVRELTRRSLKTTSSNRFIPPEWLDGVTFGDTQALKRNRRRELEYAFEDPKRSKEFVQINNQIKEAAQDVLGDLRGRRHYFRHSVVTKVGETAMSQASLIRRHRELESLRVGIGHASLHSTCQSYSHTLQCQTALFRSRRLPVMKKSEVQSLAGVKIDRTLKNQALTDMHVLKTLPSHRWAMGGKREELETRDPEKANLTPHEIFRLSILTAIGGYPAAAARLRLSKQQSLSFLDLCSERQDEFALFKGEEINQLIQLERSGRLERDASLLKMGRNQRVFKSEQKDQEKEIEPLASISEFHLMILLEVLGPVNWERRPDGAFAAVLTEDACRRAEESLKRLGLQILLVDRLPANQLGYSTFIMRGAPSDKHHPAASLRCFVAGLKLSQAWGR